MQIQNLDVISVNIWQIVISLFNLVILFLILKKFLFKPVTAILEKRKAEIEAGYNAAEEAKNLANADRAKWKATLSGAKEEADAILTAANESARYRSDKIIADAETRAQGIITEAKAEADLAYKKAKDDIRREVVDLSGALTEKLLGREISTDDHRAMIDAFLDEIGEA